MYVCVECGSSVKSLFKQYSPSVLKLCNCEACGNVADKYLEYDKVIIFIDLILFRNEAYRHVLYNGQYKSHIKLLLLQLMAISVDEWVASQHSVLSEDSDSFYVLFLIFLAVTLGKVIFFLLLLFFLNTYYKYVLKNPLDKSHTGKIWEAIVCSSFGYFLLLTVLIWDHFQREIRLLFIYTYILLSQIQALTVTTQIPRVFLGAACTLAAAADQIFSNILMTKLWS